MLDGTLVQYGEPPGMWRVGVIVGRYRHALLGDVYCVRTPYNAMAGQQFDPVPVGKVRKATQADLERSFQAEAEEAVRRMSEYKREVLSQTQAKERVKKLRAGKTKITGVNTRAQHSHTQQTA